MKTNKLREEFEKKFYKKGRTSYKQDWNLLPDDVWQFIETIIQSEKKKWKKEARLVVASYSSLSVEDTKYLIKEIEKI